MSTTHENKSDIQPEHDHSDEWREIVEQAFHQHTTLHIVGGGTKTFYGCPVQGKLFPVASHSGVITYEPTELVVTARAGTPLRDLEQVLASQGQMFAFEPPHFGLGATLGGVIASGLSGPRRPFSGALRDFVLGVRCINGKGEVLKFGGQVMKNVAGYDISRLLAGSLGTLAVLLEVSVKVLPKPQQELTLVFKKDPQEALLAMNAWAARPLPLSAACYVDGRVYLRLAGNDHALQAARKKIGGDLVPEGDLFWQSVREQIHEFFTCDDTPVWRLSLAPNTPMLDLSGHWMLDWGGAQRWFKSDLDEYEIRAAVTAVGGHATLFRGGDRNGMVFQPLPPALKTLQQRLKKAFDPIGILNPDHMYKDE